MRDKRFTFLCSENERILLTIIASRYKRSQSDTVRLLLTTAAEELGITLDVINNQINKVGKSGRQMSNVKTQ